MTSLGLTYACYGFDHGLSFGHDIGASIGLVAGVAVGGIIPSKQSSHQVNAAPEQIKESSSLPRPSERSQSGSLPALLGNTVAAPDSNLMGCQKEILASEKSSSRVSDTLETICSVSGGAISFPCAVAAGVIGGAAGLAGDIGESLIDLIPCEERLSGKPWGSLWVKTVIDCIFVEEVRLGQDYR